MESSVFYSANPSTRLRPPTTLLQSLFELCVIVGMDEDTGLVPPSRSRKSSVASTSSFDEEVAFNKEFEASILAVLSGQFISFPQSKEHVNGYPFYKQDHIACNTPSSLTPPTTSGKLRFTKHVELPLGSDVIFSLPQFCLPDGAFVYDSQPDDAIYTLVLTDIEGRRSYCSCLTFYKPYYAMEGINNPVRFLLSSKDFNKSNGKSHICYVPTCCCLISKYPYFHIAKDCLSSFLPVLSTYGNDMKEAMMKLVCKLCQVPIPPAGTVTIEFELCNTKHIIRPASEPKKRIINMDYHLPFLCFSVDNILLLLSCILTQQRIIFLASDYSLLTPIIEALLSYIQPLIWSLTYVPVLPSNLIDLLDAPGSFIMGCDSKHILQVKRLLEAQDEESGIVCANIDDGEVDSGKTLIHLIPELYRDDFKCKIKDIKLFYDLEEVSNISLLDAKEMRRRRRTFYRDCANSILEVCMDLMLNLFSDFTYFVKGQGSDKSQQVLFDRVGFVECKPEKDRQFYRQLCASQAFSFYLCERYEKNEEDFFSSAITEQGNFANHHKRSSSCLEVRHSRSSSSLSNGKIFLNTQEVFKLTPFVEEGIHTGRFYENCIRDLNNLIQKSDVKGPSVEACYLYLRGMMYVANGQIYEGLDDFFALSSKSVRIFPTNSIIEIVSPFDLTLWADLKNKSYFRKLDLLMRKNKKVAGSFRVRKQLIFEGVPRYPVGKDDFIERVMLCQITDNTKTAERLFSVLITYLGGKTIHPNTFSDLYYTLNQEDTQAQSMDIEGVTIEEREYAIKVSSLCTTNFGVGRLLLTNLRLLFMAEGTPSCRQLTRLLHIDNIEKYQHYYLLSLGVPAIRVVLKDKTLKPFFACLKTERDTWCAYLEEMADCHERAETLRDPQFISLGAQNVRLADALLKSGVPHSKALTMCYFTRTNEPAKEISAETDEFLVQRLNPSQMDTATATVEALVYLPKFDTGCTLYYEQIWCGMASGSIVIFKRATTDERWDFETQIFCTNDRISCLLAVGDSQVWAGSCDATIYVFDRFTYKANQHLDAHSDIISAIFVQPQSEKIVWSASLNGHIIGWDAENLTIYKQIRLNYQSKTCVSFLLIGNHFWCDTKSSIVVLDTERNIEHVLELKDGNNVLSIDCMTAVSSNEVWCGCGKRAKIAIFNTKTLTYTILPIQTKEKDVALTKMALTGSEIWIGNKNGLIIVVNLTREETLGKDEELRVKKTLKIHDDSVRSICVIDGGYVATGPGSKDGKIAIWRHKEETKDDLGFVTFSTKQVNDAVKFDKVTTVRPTDKSAFFNFLK